MNFAQLRQATGLTAQEIADMSGVGIRQVFRWQAQEAKVPKMVWGALERILKEKKG